MNKANDNLQGHYMFPTTIHPVDALKIMFPFMSVDTEAKLREICNELVEVPHAYAHVVIPFTEESAEVPESTWKRLGDVTKLVVDKIAKKE